MKKIITILLVCGAFMCSRNAAAQSEVGKGDVLLNAGFGFGYYFAGGVPVVLSAEFGVADAITVGPYLGFTSYRDKFFGNTYKYTFIDFGVRGSYHFSPLLNLNTDKLDLYGGLLLGYVTVSTNYDDNFPGYDPYDGTLRLGLVAGTRYYFTEKFGVNGELGLGGVAPLLLGVTFKL